MNEDELAPEAGRLIDQAKAAARGACPHLPDTGAGAAALGSSGRVYLGMGGVTALGPSPSLPCVDHTALELTRCAEQMALASARSSGEERIVAIAVASASEKVDDLVPCDRCRGLLAELDPDLPVITKQRGRWVVQPLSQVPRAGEE